MALFMELSARASCKKYTTVLVRPLGHLEPGVNGYDSTGKLVLHATKPGDVRFEKIVTSTRTGDQVRYFDGENWQQLQFSRGEKMDSLTSIQMNLNA